jgi:hypothetical protein
MAGALSCRRSSPLSTEEITGEWQKPGQELPPISLLITAEGSGFRARLRLSGVDRRASAKVSGTTLRLDFDDSLGPGEIEGRFVSKTELDLRLKPGGAPYRLRRRP